MTGGPVNLRQWRKRKKREATRAMADARAVRHGLNRAERDLTKARSEKATKELDGHKIVDDDRD
jgi:hypothetical protein